MSSSCVNIYHDYYEEVNTQLISVHARQESVLRGAYYCMYLHVYVCVGMRVLLYAVV